VTASPDIVLHHRVSQFLFEEAALLDAGRFEAWLALFTPDGTYFVPSLDDPSLSPEESLYMVVDDPIRLRSRVKQFLGNTNWSELPLSRTRRSISNVRILSSSETELVVAANFIVHRFRHREAQSFVGHYRHCLEVAGDAFRIKERRASLDQETLWQGRVTIIL
jgi:p-cumate 2,3-dioxygenase beta subunit